MSAERAASQALCGRAEDSQVPHLLTLGRIFLVERAVRSCKGLLRGCLGAVVYALCTMHFALCTMHSALCTMHYALCTMHYALCTVHFALCTMHYASIRLGVLPQSQEPAHKLQPPLIPPALDPHLVPLTFLKVDQSEEEIWSN